MEQQYIEILTHLGAAGLASILTVFILYKFFNADRLMMRKPPLGVVSDSLRYLFLRIRPRRWIFNYWEIGDRVHWVDWHRGFGYGYLDEEKLPKPGDVIQVRLRSNRQGYRGKVMRLVFYRVERPDETIPNFFIFRTVFGGIAQEQKPEGTEEIGERFRAFQRLV